MSFSIYSRRTAERRSKNSFTVVAARQPVLGTGAARTLQPHALPSTKNSFMFQRLTI